MQIILVGSYCGMSDYTFDVDVIGARSLQLREVRSLGLLTDDEVRRHKDSSYSQEWFEIKPGDRIKIRKGEGGSIEEMLFEIPATPLAVLPQRLDDTLPPKIIDLLTCLETQCTKIS